MSYTFEFSDFLTLSRTKDQFLYCLKAKPCIKNKEMSQIYLHAYVDFSPAQVKYVVITTHQLNEIQSLSKCTPTTFVRIGLVPYIFKYNKAIEFNNLI